MTIKPKRRREHLAFRVIKGGLCPADTATTSRMREKAYNEGDLVFAEITKPRNPKFMGLAHRIGELCSKNIEAFSGMDAHKVLKRIQWEANIGCEEMFVNVPLVGMVAVRIPQSLSYESMDQGEFHEVTRDFCRHIASTYWHGLSEEKIASMAESMVGE